MSSKLYHTLFVLKLTFESSGTNSAGKSGSANNIEDFFSWSATYHVRRSTVGGPDILRLDIEIPRDSLMQLDLQRWQKGASKDVRFPMAFSPDLRQVAILQSVIRVFEETDPVTGRIRYSYHHQAIDISPAQNGRPISLWDTVERQEDDYPSWYRLSFGPDGKHLMVAKRRGRPEIVWNGARGLWTITMLRDDQPLTQPLNFRLLGEICVNSTNLLLDGYFGWHPHLPIFIASGDIETLLWDFGPNGMVRFPPSLSL